MRPRAEIVITGLGIVSPLGFDGPELWQSLLAGKSGVGRITRYDANGLPSDLVAEIHSCDPREYVKPKKSLKLMARDAQLAVAASARAVSHAGLVGEKLVPERTGVIFGADRVRLDFPDIRDSFAGGHLDGEFSIHRWAVAAIAHSPPLSFLKTLPNMLPCHVSIVIDAQGPNNTLHQGDASGLLAVAEAAHVIERGQADVIIAGSASSRLHSYDLARYANQFQISQRVSDPAQAVRPFDAERDGTVFGEGAAAVILEQRAAAEARGATVLARVLGSGSACVSPRVDPQAVPKAIELAIRAALRDAGLSPGDIGHINAHGLGTTRDDCDEAAALVRALEGVPVFAPKSYWGNLAAGSGVPELALSVLALQASCVPPTLNYASPDPQCPLPVIHDQPLLGAKPTALCLNFTPQGQAVAVVIGR